MFTEEAGSNHNPVYVFTNDFATFDLYMISNGKWRLYWAFGENNIRFQDFDTKDLAETHAKNLWETTLKTVLEDVK
jgi:hypothetical protein